MIVESAIDLKLKETKIKFYGLRTYNFDFPQVLKVKLLNTENDLKRFRIH